MDVNGEADKEISEDSENVEERLLSQHPPECIGFTVDDAINSIGMGWFQINVFIFSSLVLGTQAQVILQYVFLASSWQCEFKITNTELATISTMYPIGNLIGSIPIGILSDKYGRKRVLRITNIFLLFFSTLSAFAPKYYWMVLLRLIIGVFGISGNQATTYCVEFMPIRFRAAAVVLLNLFWTLGTGILVLLCYFIIPELGWRYLVILASLSNAIIPIYSWFVPTSPRFLLQQGKCDEARKVLEFGAKLNCRCLPEGPLVYNEKILNPSIQSETDALITATNTRSQQSSEKIVKQGIRDIFSRKYGATTLMLSLLWFTSSFLYYSTILITSDLFTYDTHCQIATNTTSGTSSPPRGHFEYCEPITVNGYLEYLITTLAEVPGILITAFIPGFIGRKLTFALEFILSGIMFFLLFLCTAHSFIVKTAFLFTIRASIMGAFGLCFLYTGEVYPTSIRATVISVLSTAARLGSISSSYSTQVLFRADYIVAISIFGAFGIITGVVSLFLPFETKGKKID